ncbi:MAG TPA: efflux RND transporter periplasmic adaptor subunit [Xanthobacteraceae bacterium]|nr:efflux RND transporter periplasmic adaptor subunit [Xanthobacteraceae bacterium]
MPPETPSPAVSTRRLGLAALAVVIAAGAIVASGIRSRQSASAHLSEWTEKRAVPVVAVAPPDSKVKRATLDLPGRLEAYAQAQLYARVSGYIKDWKVDIGAPVTAGQLIAEIDAPDLDQQIMQAQADLAAAQANLVLSTANLARGQSLIASAAISKLDLEQREADASNKAGIVKSAQANLARLRALEQYKRIVAPFDGIVTARATDVGALINAGAGGGPALFVVSDTRRLRAYVNVPQAFVPSIKVGTTARITVPEYPGRNFVGTVEASAQSVEAASGTTRMQLVVDNGDGALMTGAFASVSLDLPSPEVALSVPASALIFDQDGLKVATVDGANRVVLKTVTIARDMGRAVEIGSGLNAEDRIIESPQDGIATGDAVRIAGEGTTPEAVAKQAPRPPS